MDAGPEVSALNALLARCFGPDAVLAERILQRSPRAVVAAGRMAGAPVVIKHVLGRDASGPAVAPLAGGWRGFAPLQTSPQGIYGKMMQEKGKGGAGDGIRTLEERVPDLLARLAAEHEAVAPGFAAGPWRIAPWLRSDPDHGIIVQAPAPGDRLDHCLARADAAERARVVGLAAGWLAGFTAPERVEGAFNLHRVIRRRKDHMPAALPPRDAALTGAVLAGMRAIAREQDGRAIAQSRWHGDFTPYNLFLADGPQVWAIDLQPARLRPVALDAAYFLVLAGLRWPVAGDLRHGLPAADLAAFRAACPDADGPVLRFFVADRLLRALAEGRGDEPVHAALTHWLHRQEAP